MSTLHVTFRVGTAEYAVPAPQVLHLESFTAATHVPNAPDYVRGLVQVRGRVIPVIDLRARFGLPPVEHALDHRIIVIQAGSRVAGLLVDSAREVVRLDESAISRPPELIEQQSGGFVSAIATVATRLLLLLDVPRVLGEELAHD